ncbi:hypothetical protein RFO11_003750 [Escherichia coli]|uniref:hypothetical protein n=1 Tax=Escherichia coli TaxID=562 RepID=UPI000BE1E72D|nr:hypothetical protein [Escherichia coli]EFM3349617.1 hypothetical protein [Escherichia coli]EIX4807805.1 hypothetical protein [Escherichia coli]EKM0456485.1 hypothetical protein [Escherichia coli]ELA3541387.1 hypothetical protein [Escherichia coli]EMB2764345.1 hypothetical protein [Escherichia coli]
MSDLEVYADCRPGAYGPEDWERVIDRMAEGMSILAIGKLPGYPDMATIHRHIEQDREFAALAYRIRVIAATDKLTQATEVIRDAELDPVAITKAVKLGDSLAREALNVMPRKQPSGMALALPGTSGVGNETADGVAIDAETLQLQYDEIGKARGVAVEWSEKPVEHFTERDLLDCQGADIAAAYTNGKSIAYCEDLEISWSYQIIGRGVYRTRHSEPTENIPDSTDERNAVGYTELVYGVDNEKLHQSISNELDEI